MERFKHRQGWEDALHSRFDCFTGDEVMDHDSWGHLQVGRGEGGRERGREREGVGERGVVREMDGERNVENDRENMYMYMLGSHTVFVM